jgi:hypothetical protein
LQSLESAEFARQKRVRVRFRVRVTLTPTLSLTLTSASPVLPGQCMKYSGMLLKDENNLKWAKICEVRVRGNRVRVTRVRDIRIRE